MWGLQLREHRILQNKSAEVKESELSQIITLQLIYLQNYIEMQTFLIWSAAIDVGLLSAVARCIVLFLIGLNKLNFGAFHGGSELYSHVLCYKQFYLLCLNINVAIFYIVEDIFSSSHKAALYIDIIFGWHLKVSC